MNAAPRSAQERILEIDGLRGTAIALVVMVHYFRLDPAYRPPGLLQPLYTVAVRFTNFGWTGVDLFFVLSGFLIGGILLDVRESPSYFRTFYLRRFFRIIPVYYAWVLAYIAAMAVAGSFLRAHIAGGAVPGSPYQIPIQFLFLQNLGLFTYSAVARLWFQPTWSLAVEEQFYLFAPLMVRFLSRRRLIQFLSALVVAAPLLRVWCFYHLPARGPDDLSVAYTFVLCRADALAIGILAALVWRSGLRTWLGRRPECLYGLLAVALAGVVALGTWFPDSNSLFMQSIGYTWIALFFGVLLLTAILRPSGAIAYCARAHWLRELGRVSYCLYLIHLAIGYICHAMLETTLGHVTSWEAVAANIAAAILSFGLANLSWTYFEQPLLQRGHNFKYAPAPASRAATLATVIALDTPQLR